MKKEYKKYSFYDYADEYPNTARAIIYIAILVIAVLVSYFTGWF